jgi:hypothetical protein
MGMVASERVFKVLDNEDFIQEEQGKHIAENGCQYSFYALCHHTRS